MLIFSQTMFHFAPQVFDLWGFFILNEVIMETNDQQPKKYTCIKTTVIQGKKITIGDESPPLVMSQARPLQNGGFITFDEDAAQCIRHLTNKQTEVQTEVQTDAPENTGALNSELTPVADSEAVESKTGSHSDDQSSHEGPLSTSSVSVGFEKGD